MSTYVWDLELFSTLETLNILEERFSVHLVNGQPKRLRANVKLAAW
jgi:hypothetical protein